MSMARPYGPVVWSAQVSASGTSAEPAGPGPDQSPADLPEPARVVGVEDPDRVPVDARPQLQIPAVATDVLDRAQRRLDQQYADHGGGERAHRAHPHRPRTAAEPVLARPAEPAEPPDERGGDPDQDGRGQDAQADQHPPAGERAAALPHLVEAVQRVRAAVHDD